MRSGASIIAESIERAVDYKLARSMRPRSKTVTGVYVGKDGEGKAWVRLSGAEAAIPVRRMAVQADVGDTVSVTVGNGRAVVDSNVSNPSASSTTVTKVERRAVVAQETAVKAVDYAVEAQAASAAARASANGAQISAEKAHVAADNAEADAIRAHNAADEAMAEAVIAHEAADSAQASANSASDDAARANTAANDAIVQLSNVEGVVDTLGWFATHATPTSDEQVDPTKTYYTYDGASYSAVDEPSDENIKVYSVTTDSSVDPEKTYYILDDGEYVEVDDPTDEGMRSYVQTTDEEIDSEKIYYVLDDGEYVPVAEPDAGEIASYYELVTNYYEYVTNYYELDATIQNYVASHLALTDDGLFLVMDGSDMRLKIDTNGVYVTDGTGHEVASFTDSGVHFDSATPQRVGGDSSYIRYYDSDGNGTADSMEISADAITLAGNDVTTVLGGIEDQLSTVVSGLEQSSYFTQTESGFAFSIDSAIDGAMQAADDARRYATDYLSFDDGELTIGTSDSGVTAVLTNSKFAFVSDSAEMATFGLNDSEMWEMHIANTFVDDMLRFGNFAWIKRDNGNMSLKWIG